MEDLKLAVKAISDVLSSTPRTPGFAARVTTSRGVHVITAAPVRPARTPRPGSQGQLRHDRREAYLKAVASVG